VSRHVRNCVPARIRESMKPEPAEVADLNVVNALTTSHQTILDILRDSLADCDRKHALLALQTEIRQLDLIAKVTGQVNTGPQMNFVVNPEFVRLKQVIVEKLLPYPEARLALSDALDALAEESNDGG
jgi:type II secretory pathway predicted ATPase ExeA